MARRPSREPLLNSVVDVILKYHDSVEIEETNLNRTHLSSRQLRARVLHLREQRYFVRGVRRFVQGSLEFDEVSNVLSEAENEKLGSTCAAPVSAEAAEISEPPRRAHQILCLIYSPDRLEDVAGTMEELFHKVERRHGTAFARLWYWCQVAGCLVGRTGFVLASASELVGLKRT